MKSSTDKHRRDVHFEVGEWVFLKLRPHRQQSIIRRINQKLTPHFYSPFLVIAKVGPVAYKLQLPESARILPVFHVSLLKKDVGCAPVEPDLPQGLMGDSNVLRSPKQCLAQRTITRNRTEVDQYLIQWDMGTAEDATWEDAFNIHSNFPSFKLEDTLDLHEEGSDGNQDTEPNDLAQPDGPNSWIVYRRRPKPRVKS